MRDHQSLKAWELSRDLSQAVHQFSLRVWHPSISPALDQLRRSSLSVRLNLVDGYSWRPSRRWLHHLRIAMGSAVESSECLRFLREVGVLSGAEATRLATLARDVERLIWA
jgi:four helix bundle protein